MQLVTKTNLKILKLSNIKNIIFDLGGVIIEIDPDRTTTAFSRIIGKPFDEIKARIEDLKLFYKYEVGELTDQEFRELVRQFVERSITDEEIDAAWNDLLLEIPFQRIDLLKDLQSSYRTFLLSNTNFIHYRQVERILSGIAPIHSFSNLFEKVYLSYELKLCKPDEKIYNFVLNDAGLKPEETLFIDDNFNNIQSASALGINTIHLQPPTTILDIFKHNLS